MTGLYRPYTVLLRDYKVDTAKAPKKEPGRYSNTEPIPSRIAPKPLSQTLTPTEGRARARGRSGIRSFPTRSAALTGPLAGKIGRQSPRMTRA
jgi:hypothetical protein